LEIDENGELKMKLFNGFKKTLNSPIRYAQGKQLSILNSSKGFTFIELIVVMTLFSILVGYVVINLVGARHQTSLQSAASEIVADLHNQQMKALYGATEGVANASSYGVYFDNSSYTLFKGNSYLLNDPSNFVIDLDPSLEFSSINLPGSQIIYERVSGEVVSFNPSQTSVTLRNKQTSQQFVIATNKYGVIIQAN
jgi:prepilin-type N-terminal cleavage/methylation domain-containing protein